MAYPNDSDDGLIQFKQLGGMNEKFSPHALPSPDFSYVHGLYAERQGALERVPGTMLLAQAGNGTAAVWNIFQPNDGTDNIIVQTSDGTERVFTLSEIYNRAVISDITYSPLPDDEDMPTAIILQDAANGVDGGSIGASANTWYTRELTSNPLNEDAIIQSFTSGSSGSFVLAPGTYRIRGFVCAAIKLDSTADVSATATGAFQAALVNTTDGVTQSVGSPGYVEYGRQAAARIDLGFLTTFSFFDDTFVVSTSNKTFNIQNAYSTAGASLTTSCVCGMASDVTATLNGAAVRQPYLRLVISKVA